MGYDDLIRSGVALAKTLTADLQVSVSVQHWMGQDEFGRSTYTAATTYRCLVMQNARNIRMKDGQEVTSKSVIYFLEQVADTTPLTGQVRENPIDERDKITLPGGITGPILATSGFVDGQTEIPYYVEVFMGRSEQAQ